MSMPVRYFKSAVKIVDLGIILVLKGYVYLKTPTKTEWKLLKLYKNTSV